MTSFAPSAPCLTVKDSVLVATIRAVVAAGVAAVCAYYGLKPNYQPDFPCGLVGTVAFIVAVFSADVAKNPQTSLIIGEGGIWTPEASSVAWEELRGYYSLAESHADRSDSNYFVFTRHDGPEIKVDLAAADTDTNAIRAFIRHLDTGQPLRDEGHRRT